jgi:hypothetical protein
MVRKEEYVSGQEGDLARKRDVRAKKEAISGQEERIFYP